MQIFGIPEVLLFMVGPRCHLIPEVLFRIKFSCELLLYNLRSLYGNVIKIFLSGFSNLILIRL